jgi:hypothetical protein
MASCRAYTSPVLALIPGRFQGSEIRLGAESDGGKTLLNPTVTEFSNSPNPGCNSVGSVWYGAMTTGAYVMVVIEVLPEQLVGGGFQGSLHRVVTSRQNRSIRTPLQQYSDDESLV